MSDPYGPGTPEVVGPEIEIPLPDQVPEDDNEGSDDDDEG